jgi:NADH-quinone oxidoreductase subunit L
MTVPLMILAALSIIGGWVGWPAALGGSNRFEHFLSPVMQHRYSIPINPHGYNVRIEVRTITPEEAARAQAAISHRLRTEYGLMVASVLVALLGIWVARRFYLQNPAIPERLVANWPRLHRLIYRKYYVDEIYDAMFVNRAKDLGTTLGAFDSAIVDGLGVDGTGWLTRATSRISIWWDTWIVDGLVNFIGWLAQILSLPAKLVQTGIVSNYALLIVLGMVFLLGYYVRVLHHIVR